MASIPGGPKTRVASTDLDFSHTPWQLGYSRRLLATDTVVLMAATLLAAVLRFGAVSDDSNSFGGVPPLYFVGGVAIAVMWSAMLAVSRTRDPRIIGRGADEYA